MPTDRGVALVILLLVLAGHAMGLPHPEGAALDGTTLLDPFDGTTGFDDTIMGSVLFGAPLAPSSLRFSPQQAFMMQRSALLD